MKKRKNMDFCCFVMTEAIFRSINRMRFGWKSHASYQKSHATFDIACHKIHGIL